MVGSLCLRPFRVAPRLGGGVPARAAAVLGCVRASGRRGPCRRALLRGCASGRLRSALPRRAFGRWVCSACVCVCASAFFVCLRCFFVSLPRPLYPLVFLLRVSPLAGVVCPCCPSKTCVCCGLSAKKCVACVFAKNKRCGCCGLVRAFCCACRVCALCVWVVCGVCYVHCAVLPALLAPNLLVLCRFLRFAGLWPCVA